MQILFYLSIVIGGISILIALHYFKHGRKKDNKIQEKIQYNDDVREVQESASDIIRTFNAYIKLPFEKSGLTRPQRRKVKKHYIKFCYKWIDMPKEKRDVVSIVRHIVVTSGDKDLVAKYLNKK